MHFNYKIKILKTFLFDMHKLLKPFFSNLNTQKNSPTSLSLYSEVRNLIVFFSFGLSKGPQYLNTYKS